jgi:hypothetical protein
MTTGMTKFTPQQRSVIAGAPLLAAMWVIADTRRSTRATFAAVRAYRDARGSYDTELLRDLLATPPADAIKRPHDREALRREAPAALRQAIEIIDRIATTHEQTEYRRLVLTLAEATGRAARKGGLFRRSRATETDSERDALRSITAILDR